MNVSTWFQNIFLNSNKQKLHFVGFGGAGSNTVEYFHKKGVKGKFTCVSYPERNNLPSDIKFITFVPPKKGNYITGKDSSGIYDVKQVLILPKIIKHIFENNDKFILFAGLGGYTGTFMIKETTMLLNNLQKDFKAICSLPFEFEGKERKIFANKIYEQLHTYSWFKHYNLEGIKQKYGNLPVNIAFDKANEELYNILFIK